MPRKKRSLVLEIALTDRESFKILPTKKQAKNIYNKVRNKLVRQGVTGELLQTKLIGEIRRELFAIQEPYKPKSEIREEDSHEEAFFKRDRFEKPIRGYDIWGECEEPIDPIQQLQDNFNKTVKKGFRDVFCPNCRSNPCICREGY